MQPSYRNLTAPDLVKEWKRLVNSPVMMGRDARFMKEALMMYTPVQIMLGIHRTKSATTTIPMFVKSTESWLEEDELLAEIELACIITGHTPPEYFTYLEYRDEETAYAFNKSLEARLKLREWADGVLS